MFGEHTDEVLTEAGFSSGEIETMRNNNTFETPGKNHDSNDERTVKIVYRDGIGWVYLNRPKKKNAMIQLHIEMDQTLQELEGDPNTKVVVVAARAAGLFRWTGSEGILSRSRAPSRRRPAPSRRSLTDRRWDQLFMPDEPTIAMVDGCCSGGAFSAAHRRRLCGGS